MREKDLFYLQNLLLTSDFLEDKKDDDLEDHLTKTIINLEEDSLESPLTIMMIGNDK